MSDDAFVLQVTCDVNRRCFYMISSEGDEKFIECESSDEFVNVWNFVHAMLSEDEIKYCLLYTSDAADE